MVDFFVCVGGASIDILKIDIEGGEYQLLRDDRFAQLRPNFVVLEYHGSFEEKSGDVWCDERLRQLGYTVTCHPKLAGQILWAQPARNTQ